MENEDKKTEETNTQDATSTAAEILALTQGEERQVKITTEDVTPTHQVSVEDASNFEAANPHLDARTAAKTQMEMEHGRLRLEEHKGREAMRLAKNKGDESEASRVSKAGEANKDL